ncbi:hypothetical protein G3576_27355 [Roseomonas stagni]|uniref:Uncharacterized protein n=1 Tax=Falsiroseomonas algicola TaxID=2716930 RepID=A0A6M1LU89_9PROT|nr:hypothetical protein [Falsiroseomonas algicola]NGM23757.1 hypothetical protein [Falsiroseomonas algicola]
MRGLPKLAFWLLGLTGVGLWTALIMALARLPLPVELALGGMGLVCCFWGHAILFPTERATIAAAAPGRMAREDMLHSVSTAPLPTGAARTLSSRPRRDRNAAMQDIPPGDLPPLLRSPFEEAARMEARRLAEAITATGVFGPVTVTLQADGTALVAPVQAQDAVRLPAATVLRFATLATLPDGLAPNGALQPGQGLWPGKDLQAAMEAHILAATGIAPDAAPLPPAPTPAALPAWATPLPGSRTA